MNKIFKVIFNRHLNKMVVTSELARGVTRAKSEKVQSAVKASLTLAAALVLGAVSVSAGATIKDTSIGKKITISSPKGSANNNSPNGIAIGNGAYIEDMGPHTEEGIAIGTNAKALDGTRRSGLAGGVSGIAIGKSTYASESTIDIGAKSAGSEAQGANRRGVVSIGADTYAAAHFATMTGAYSSIKTNPNVTTKGLLFGFFPVSGPAMQGFGSVSNGAFNYIKADSPDGNNGEPYDGMANAITGVANTIEHSNGALIYGAGNRISHSKKDLELDTSDIDFNNILEPDALNEVLNKRNAEGEKPLSGSVGVFGGGNTVDYAHLSNVTGVDNTLTGTDGNESERNSLTGFKNTATNVHDLFNAGSHNTTTNASESIVIGNYNKLSGTNADRSDVNRNIVIGFQDKDSEKIGKNIKNNQIIGSDVTVYAGTTKGVLLGDGAEIAASNTDNTTALSGAVALGSESKADRQALDNTKVVTDNEKIAEAAKDNKVYAMDGASDTDKQAIKDTVKGSLAAVSVGNSASTRQIINVAAGSEDTDAVNVAQLRAVGNKVVALASDLASKKNVVVEAADDSVTVTSDDKNGTTTYKIKANASGSITINTDKGNKVVNLGDSINIKGGINNATATGNNANVTDGNIGVVSNNGNIEVKLGKDLKGLGTVKGDTIEVDNVKVGGKTYITKNGIDANNKKITNVADGDISANSSDAVNGKQLANVKTELEKKITNSNSAWDLTVEDGSASTIGKGSKVNFTSEDKNIKITKTTDSNNKVDIDLKLSDSVTIGATAVNNTNGSTTKQGGTIIDKNGVYTDGGNGPSITISGINANNKKITNVARGTAPTDAVNMQQLNEVKSDVNAVDKRASAGTASAMAASGLPQAYLPGHSMVAVSAGSHRDQSAVAVGVSRISDSGHVIFKLNGVTNSKGDMSSSIGVGYQW